MSAETFAHADSMVCPGGPLLLRGANREVTDDDGQVHLTTRPVSAVCRCKKSQDLPWCDGTHQLLPRDKRP